MDVVEQPARGDAALEAGGCAPDRRSEGCAAESVWPAWMAGWAGLAVVGVANGVAREVLYTDRVGDDAAHRISTATLLGAFALALPALDRRRPLPTARVAWQVGGALAGLTVGFEVLLGTALRRRPLAEVLADYDVRAGRVWAAVPLFLLAGPPLVRLRRVRGR